MAAAQLPISASLNMPGKKVEEGQEVEDGRLGSGLKEAEHP